MGDLLEFLSVPAFWEQPLIAVVLISIVVFLIFTMRGERKANQQERDAASAERKAERQTAAADRARHEQFMADLVLRSHEDGQFLVTRFDELVVQGHQAQERTGQALEKVAAGVATLAESTATQMARHEENADLRSREVLRAIRENKQPQNAEGGE